MDAVVRHAIFGEGKVTRIADSFIEVEFGYQIKKFQFPQAFVSFLETNDVSLLSTIAEANAKKTVETATLQSNNQKNANTVAPKPQNHRYNNRSHNDASNPLVGERAQTIAVSSVEEMFEIVGYMAKSGRVNSIEAEVPKDGRDDDFERIFPGQTYRPIELGDTPSGMPNKLSPQFRINFGNLSNCPDALKNNMGKGTGSCVGRINKSRFVITIVQNYGFRFGDWQDRIAIRDIAVNSGYADAFDRGYSR